MARNGSGTYILPPSNPVVSGTVIESDWANDTMADLAAALTQSIAYDGQTIPIANLPMGGFHHTSVSDPTQRNQYATLGYVQDSKHTRMQVTGGVDNITGNLPGGATSYVAGGLISFFATATNTGAMTLDYNGIGPRGLVNSNGLPMTAGQIVAGAFVLAYYDGTQFKVLSNVSATAAAALLALATTGQKRPGGGAYAQLTIATPTSINVPAGSAWIVPPNSDSPDDATEVSWSAQTITLTFLATSFTTTIAVNSAGQIIQISGRALGASLRNAAVLGVVEHITGAANSIITKPTIFADDCYRTTDLSSLLTNTIISGGLVTPNGVSLLQLDISAGSIFMPGGSANELNNPNVWSIAQQTSFPFRTLAGQNTLGPVISNAPVTSYDPNGTGVVTTLPANNDTVVHRIYYLYGSFIWVYGQRIFNDVENAMSLLEWDRSQYKPSLFLMDATLVAEVIAIKNTASLGNTAQCRIVAPGGINFSIGSPGGISEAPIDGFPYGRLNAAWSRVLAATAPSALNSLTVTGSPNVPLSLVQTPVVNGTLSFRHRSGLNDWFTIETTSPDNRTYFRSWNAGSGALVATTSINHVDGSWAFAKNITFSSNGSRIFGNFGTATLIDRPIFQSNLSDNGTSVGAMPNGLSQVANYVAYGSSNPTDAAFFQAGIQPGATFIRSSYSGIGQPLSLVIEVAPTTGATHPLERIRLPATQNRFQYNCNVGPRNNWMQFQSVNSASTYVMAIPNGAAVDSAFLANTNVDPDNSAFIMMGTNNAAGYNYISSSKIGSGTFREMVFTTSDLERMRIGNNGNVGIGTADMSLAKLFVYGNIMSSGTITAGRNGGPGPEGGELDLIGVDGVSVAGFVDIAAGNAMRIFNIAGGKISLFTNGGERLIVNGGEGTVEIRNGDASFGGLLKLSSQSSGNSRTVRVAAASANLEFINSAFSSATHIFGNDGSTQMTTTCSTFADNTGNLGSPSQRWGTVFAVGGTINTSDERLKTPLAPFTPQELAAAKDIAKEIKTYKWLDAVEEKGGAARTHIGVGAQTVIAIMESHGLKPFDYGFICYDEWEATEYVDAGGRYAVRYDELAMFIARGQEQRLAALEAKLGM